MKLSPIVALLLLASLAAAHTDLLTSPANADLLDQELSAYHSALFGQHQQSGLKNLKHASNLGGLPKFLCTNGKDPNTLNSKQYVDEFSAGPCSPVILLAGIGGTKMHIEIACETFKANNPLEWQTCGWSSCSDSFFSNSPKKEYKIWIPDVLSPISVLNPVGKSKSCFAALFKTKWVRVGDTLTPTEMKGITIHTIGDSPDTRYSKGCGFDAITNLLPIGSILTPEKYKQFNKFKEQLLSAGYKLGVTAQAMPYDWRLPVANNQAASKMERIMTNLYSITGKKVSIVAHSFGNLNTLNVLAKMSQEKKDNIVNRYYAIAPPFTGSPKIMYLTLGGSTDYSMGPVGINFDMMKLTLAQYGGVYNLMPTPFYSFHQNESWMKSIQNQIARDKGLSPPHSLGSEDIVARLFPDNQKVCYPNEWKARGSKCKSGLQFEDKLGSINREAISSSNIADILRRYSYSDLASGIFEATREAHLLYGKNPGVETVIIYGNLLETVNFFQYNADPKAQTLAAGGKPVMPDSTTTTLGDETVLVSSALGPGIKWASQFEKGLAGAKPVIFGEVCSIVNKKSSVFQSSFGLQTNEYQGIPCNCKTKGSEGACDHLGLVSDDSVMDYIFTSLADYKKDSSPRKFDNWSSDTVQAYEDSCYILHN